MKTNREVFDFVKNHLLTQNERSMINGVCQYRGNSGLKCAVGCLIDNVHYDKDFENQAAYNQSVKSAVQASIGFEPDNSLLCALQGVHDYEPVKEWPMHLKRVEARYSLLGIL
jgi:hypothetical protein